MGLDEDNTVAQPEKIKNLKEWNFMRRILFGDSEINVNFFKINSIEDVERINSVCDETNHNYTEENSILSDYIKNNYVMKAVHRPSLNIRKDKKIKKPPSYFNITDTQIEESKPENLDMPIDEYIKYMRQSLIQKTLTEQGIEGDLFIFIDVVLSNIRQDLTFVKKKSESSQKVFHILTPQGIYDQGNKTSFVSGKPFGFNEKESNFIYSWETSLPGISKSYMYPHWNKKINFLERNKVSKEEQFITGTDILMIPSMEKFNPLKGKIHVYIKELDESGKTTGKYILLDNTTATKTSNIACLPKVDNLTFLNKVNSAFKRLVDIFIQKSDSAVFSDITTSVSGSAAATDSGPVPAFAGVSAVADTYIEEPTAISATASLNNSHMPYLMLAKRLGDAAQAISCCNESIPYSYFKDNDGKTVIYKEENILKSNGNHVFISLDRLCISAALMYLTPIVIYSIQGGSFIILTRKDLTKSNKELQQIQQNHVLTLSKLSDILQTDITDEIPDDVIDLTDLSVLQSTRIPKKEFESIMEGREMAKIKRIHENTLKSIQIFKTNVLEGQILDFINSAEYDIIKIESEIKEIMFSTIIQKQVRPLTHIVKNWNSKNIDNKITTDGTGFQKVDERIKCYLSVLLILSPVIKLIYSIKSMFLKMDGLFANIMNNIEIIENIKTLNKSDEDILLKSSNEITEFTKLMTELRDSIILFNDTAGINNLDLNTFFNIFKFSPKDKYTVKNNILSISNDTRTVNLIKWIHTNLPNNYGDNISNLKFFTFDTTDNIYNNEIISPVEKYIGLYSIIYVILDLLKGSDKQLFDEVYNNIKKILIILKTSKLHKDTTKVLANECLNQLNKKYIQTSEGIDISDIAATGAGDTITGGGKLLKSKNAIIMRQKLYIDEEINTLLLMLLLTYNYSDIETSIMTSDYDIPIKVIIEYLLNLYRTSVTYKHGYKSDPNIIPSIKKGERFVPRENNSNTIITNPILEQINAHEFTKQLNIVLNFYSELSNKELLFDYQIYYDVLEEFSEEEQEIIQNSLDNITQEAIFKSEKIYVEEDPSKRKREREKEVFEDDDPQQNPEKLQRFLTDDGPTKIQFGGNSNKKMTIKIKKDSLIDKKLKLYLLNE